MEGQQKRVEGDGRAEFLADMTEEEYARHVIEEDHGWRSFYDKVLGRKTDEHETSNTES